MEKVSEYGAIAWQARQWCREGTLQSPEWQKQATAKESGAYKSQPERLVMSRAGCSLTLWNGWRDLRH